MAGIITHAHASGLLRKDFQVLDPSAGEGAFVEALLNKGVPANQITAFEIDPVKVEAIGRRYPGVEACAHDTLLDTTRRFDACIGNPPYKSRRNSEYLSSNRKSLEKLYQDIGLYNLYSLFIVNCVRRLYDGGILCFIVADDFMTNRYYTAFRTFLLNSTQIIEILLAPTDLFHPAGADIRTAILTLRKLPPALFSPRLMDNKVRLIDRLPLEDFYDNPPCVQEVIQSEFARMPANSFFVGVPLSLIQLVQNPPSRFGSVAAGATGISTGNDGKYLRRFNEIKDDPSWVPFYKSGKRRPYFYKTDYYIEKDYERNEKDSNFIIRNRKYFFQEGITCSSVGRRFSASYLPPGCIFGVNANFFFKERGDLFYCLGYLNSRLCHYLARKVLHRSNIVATSFLEELPFKQPNPQTKAKIAELSASIVNELMKNPNYNFEKEQNQIDNIIFELYAIDPETRKEVETFYTNIMVMA
jgi:adenine-specific DNA-methyltransferase